MYYLIRESQEDRYPVILDCVNALDKHEALKLLLPTTFAGLDIFVENDKGDELGWREEGGIKWTEYDSDEDEIDGGWETASDEEDFKGYAWRNKIQDKINKEKEENRIKREKERPKKLAKIAKNQKRQKFYRTILSPLPKIEIEKVQDDSEPFYQRIAQAYLREYSVEKIFDCFDDLKTIEWDYTYDIYDSEMAKHFYKRGTLLSRYEYLWNIKKCPLQKHIFRVAKGGVKYMDSDGKLWTFQKKDFTDLELGLMKDINSGQVKTELPTRGVQGKKWSKFSYKIAVLQEKSWDNVITPNCMKNKTEVYISDKNFVNDFM